MYCVWLMLNFNICVLQGISTIININIILEDEYMERKVDEGQ